MLKIVLKASSMPPSRESKQERPQWSREDSHHTEMHLGNENNICAGTTTFFLTLGV